MHTKKETPMLDKALDQETPTSLLEQLESKIENPEQRMATVNALFDKAFTYQMLAFMVTAISGAENIEALKTDLTNIHNQVAKHTYGKRVNEYSNKVLASVLSNIDAFADAMFKTEEGEKEVKS